MSHLLLAACLSLAQICACMAAYNIGKAAGIAEAGIRYLELIEAEHEADRRRQ